MLDASPVTPAARSHSVLGCVQAGQKNAKKSELTVSGIGNTSALPPSPALDGKGDDMARLSVVLDQLRRNASQEEGAFDACIERAAQRADNGDSPPEVLSRLEEECVRADVAREFITTLRDSELPFSDDVAKVFGPKLHAAVGDAATFEAVLSRLVAALRSAKENAKGGLGGWHELQAAIGVALVKLATHAVGSAAARFASQAGGVPVLMLRSLLDVLQAGARGGVGPAAQAAVLPVLAMLPSLRGSVPALDAFIGSLSQQVTETLEALHHQIAHADDAMCPAVPQLQIAGALAAAVVLYSVQGYLRQQAQSHAFDNPCARIIAGAPDALALVAQLNRVAGAHLRVQQSDSAGVQLLQKQVQDLDTVHAALCQAAAQGHSLAQALHRMTDVQREALLRAALPEALEPLQAALKAGAGTSGGIAHGEEDTTLEWIGTAADMTVTACESLQTLAGIKDAVHDHLQDQMRTLDEWNGVSQSGKLSPGAMIAAGLGREGKMGSENRLEVFENLVRRAQRSLPDEQKWTATEIKVAFERGSPRPLQIISVGQADAVGPMRFNGSSPSAGTAPVFPSQPVDAQAASGSSANQAGAAVLLAGTVAGPQIIDMLEEGIELLPPAAAGAVGGGGHAAGRLRSGGSAVAKVAFVAATGLVTGAVAYLGKRGVDAARVWWQGAKALDGVDPVVQQADGSWSDGFSRMLAQSLSDAHGMATVSAPAAAGLGRMDDMPKAERLVAAQGEADPVAPAGEDDAQQRHLQTSFATAMMTLGDRLAGPLGWVGWERAPTAEKMLLVETYLKAENTRGKLKSLQQLQAQAVGQGMREKPELSTVPGILHTLAVTLPGGTVQPLVPYLMYRHARGDEVQHVHSTTASLSPGEQQGLKQFIKEFDADAADYASVRPGAFADLDALTQAFQAEMKYDAVRGKVAADPGVMPALGLLLKLINQVSGVELATLKVSLNDGAGKAVEVEVPDYLLVRNVDALDEGQLVYRPEIHQFRFVRTADELRSFFNLNTAVSDVVGMWGGTQAFPDAVVKHVPGPDKAWATALLERANAGDWQLNGPLPAPQLGNARRHAAADSARQRLDRAGQATPGRPHVVVQPLYRSEERALARWSMRLMNAELQVIRDQDHLERLQYSSGNDRALKAQAEFVAASEHVLVEYASFIHPKVEDDLRAILHATRGNHGPLHIPDLSDIQMTVQGAQGTRTDSLLSWATYGWKAHGLTGRFSDPNSGDHDPQWPRRAATAKVSFQVTHATADGVVMDVNASQWLNQHDTKRAMILQIMDRYGWQKVERSAYIDEINRRARDMRGDVVQKLGAVVQESSRMAVIRSEALNRLSNKGATELRRALDAMAASPDRSAGYAAVTVSGVEMAGIWAVKAGGREYIFAPGSHLSGPITREAFAHLLGQSSELFDAVLRCAPLGDNRRLTEAFNARASVPMAVSTTPSTLDASVQVLVQRKLSDVDAVSTSAAADMRRMLEDVARTLLAIPCLAGGPVGAAICAAGTSMFIVKDLVEGANALYNGDLDQALELTLAAAMDSVDVLEFFDSHLMAALLFRTGMPGGSTVGGVDELVGMWDAVKRQNAGVDGQRRMIGGDRAVPDSAVREQGLVGVDGIDHIITADGNLRPSWVDSRNVRRVADLDDAPAQYVDGAWRLLDQLPPPLQELTDRVLESVPEARWMTRQALQRVLARHAGQSIDQLPGALRQTIRNAGIRSRIEALAIPEAQKPAERTTQGNGVWDADGEQYIRYDGTWLRTGVVGESRYAKTSDGVLDRQLQFVYRAGQWEGRATSRLKGGMRDILERRVSEIHAAYPMSDLLSTDELHEIVAIVGAGDGAVLREMVRISARERFLQRIGDGTIDLAQSSPDYAGVDPGLGILTAYTHAPALSAGQGIALNLPELDGVPRQVLLGDQFDPLRLDATEGMPGVDVLMDELGLGELRRRLGLPQGTAEGVQKKFRADLTAHIGDYQPDIAQFWESASHEIALQSASTAELVLMRQADLTLAQSREFLEHFPAHLKALAEGEVISSLSDDVGAYTTGLAERAARMEIVSGLPTTPESAGLLVKSLQRIRPGAALRVAEQGALTILVLHRGGGEVRFVLSGDGIAVEGRHFESWQQAFHHYMPTVARDADVLREKVLRDLAERSPIPSSAGAGRAQLLGACKKGRGTRTLCTPDAAPEQVTRKWKELKNSVAQPVWTEAATPTDWGGPGNILVVEGDLHYSGHDRPFGIRKYASRGSMGGRNGFERGGVNQVDIVLPVRLRPGSNAEIRSGAGDSAVYKHNGFSIPNDVLNSVRIDGRYWNGKAVPPAIGESGVEVQKMSAALRTQLINARYDRKFLSQVENGAFFLRTKVRRCTEVQAAEQLATHVGAMKDGFSVDALTGSILMVSRLAPCLKNCEDLLREMGSKWPNVALWVADLDRAGAPRLWRPRQPIPVPPRSTPVDRPAGQARGNSWSRANRPPFAGSSASAAHPPAVMLKPQVPALNPTPASVIVFKPNPNAKEFKPDQDAKEFRPDPNAKEFRPNINGAGFNP